MSGWVTNYTGFGPYHWTDDQIRAIGATGVLPETERAERISESFQGGRAMEAHAVIDALVALGAATRRDGT